ncbi:hypothetical protein QBC39DRAFT_380001 [Podospora conica]|nr:hypothetical protein QBC39DRAFT_380001 [Schizothecium conicum]
MSSGPPPGVASGGGPPPGVPSGGGPLDAGGAMLGLPITAFQIQSSRIFISAIAPIFTVATLLFIARIFSRWRTRGISADDYVLVFAFILGVIEMALTIAITSPNLATPSPQFLAFSELSRVTPMTLISQVFNQFAVALVKTSIALMLIRLQQARGWKVFLYFLIVVQVLVAIFTTVMHTTRCIPIEAVWNFSIASKRCWSEDAFKYAMTVASSLVVATDLVYALMPITFLHHIRRSTLHRALIAVLLSLGLVASAASVVKTVMVHRGADDRAGHGIVVATWATIEVQIGIMAACIPTLRADALKVLGWLGWYKEDLSAHRQFKSDFSAQLPGENMTSGGGGGRGKHMFGGGSQAGGTMASAAKASTESLADRSETEIWPYGVGASGTRFEMVDVKR